MTSIEQKILHYISYSKCKYLLNSSLILIRSSVLSGQSFKHLKKLVQDGNAAALELKLIEHFQKYKIDYPKKENYINKHRQQAHRSKNKLLGKKQLNFYVDESLFNDIQTLKSELNLSYSELLSYLFENLKK
jgi:hypothetical protein